MAPGRPKPKSGHIGWVAGWLAEDAFGSILRWVNHKSANFVTERTSEIIEFFYEKTKGAGTCAGGGAG